MDLDQTDEAQIWDALAYAGIVLVAHELVKSLIVEPVKSFYRDITFGPGMPFVSYEADVLSRHKNDFEACLLYLKDFMRAIDSEDVDAIQALRRHRNDIAHRLPERVEGLVIEDYAKLLQAAERALFKLSNHNAYMEIGADPVVRAANVDWTLAEGHEYTQFKAILGKVQRLRDRLA